MVWVSQSHHLTNRSCEFEKQTFIQPAFLSHRYCTEPPCTCRLSPPKRRAPTQGAVASDHKKPRSATTCQKSTRKAARRKSATKSHPQRSGTKHRPQRAPEHTRAKKDPPPPPTQSHHCSAHHQAANHPRPGESKEAQRHTQTWTLTKNSSP